MGSLRDVNASRLSKTLQSRGDIHAVAEEVVAAHYHVTDMHPDPESKALLIWLILINGYERVLHFDSTPNGINGAGEFGQNAVTSSISDPATMFSDEPVHDLAMSGQDPDGCILILAHQTRVACHISRKDSSQPPLDPVLLQTHGALGVSPDPILLVPAEGVQPGSEIGQHPAAKLRQDRTEKTRRSGSS
ncbi:hypothetical protein MAE02_66920 [Microvirga aerophila]|uniref:Uncharacterized protein n=1 Tax=Microvirga aerophila TaxID=670291 RepID=A0A512C457_9HYPH|nr:hypothetical protein MAE02_66920 [Microvirga aerophila]